MTAGQLARPSMPTAGCCDAALKAASEARESGSVMENTRNIVALLEGSVTRRQVLKRSVALGLSVPVVGALLAACGSSDKKATNTASSAGAPTATTSAGGAAGSPAAGGAAKMVDMKDDFKFDPASLTVKVGDTVTWMNAGAMPHTSTCDPSKAANKSDIKQPDGGDTWDSGMLNGGQSYSHTFKVAGDYQYVCTPHESLGMIGTITVEA
jgi:plastocyanin